MNHRFSPRALARFGRKKVRLGGLPCPLAWMAGFLGDRPWAGRPQRPPYPAAVDGHYLTFCAGEAIRFEHLFSPLRESWPGGGEIQRPRPSPGPHPGQPGRGRPKPSGGRRPAESTGNPGRPAGPADRTAHPGRDRLGRTGRPGPGHRPGQESRLPRRGQPPAPPPRLPWRKGPCPSSGSPSTGGGH